MSSTSLCDISNLKSLFDIRYSKPTNFYNILPNLLLLTSLYSQIFRYSVAYFPYSNNAINIIGALHLFPFIPPDKRMSLTSLSKPPNFKIEHPLGFYFLLHLSPIVSLWAIHIKPLSWFY